MIDKKPSMPSIEHGVQSDPPIVPAVHSPLSSILLLLDGCRLASTLERSIQAIISPSARP